MQPVDTIPTVQTTTAHPVDPPTEKTTDQATKSVASEAADDILSTETPVLNGVTTDAVFESTMMEQLLAKDSLMMKKLMMDDLMEAALEHTLRLSRQEEKEGAEENYTEPTFQHFPTSNPLEVLNKLKEEVEGTEGDLDNSMEEVPMTKKNMTEPFCKTLKEAIDKEKALDDEEIETPEQENSSEPAFQHFPKFNPTTVESVTTSSEDSSELPEPFVSANMDEMSDKALERTM